MNVLHRLRNEERSQIGLAPGELLKACVGDAQRGPVAEEVIARDEHGRPSRQHGEEHEHELTHERCRL